MICRIHTAFALALLFLYAGRVNASLISGFENGLAGWEYVGDVSAQDSSVGTTPTQGKYVGFITTLCDQRVVNWCNTSLTEVPYSGHSSLMAVSSFLGPTSVAAFLGLPTDNLDGPGSFGAQFPVPPYSSPQGE